MSDGEEDAVIGLRAGGARPSLADVLSGVLAEELDASEGGPSAGPILVKRKRVELRLAQTKRKAAEEAVLLRVKHERRRRGHVPLGSRATHADPEDVYDTSLDALMRQIATRGVVRLFNAVQQAQGGGGGAPTEPGSGAAAARRERGEGGAEGVTGDDFLQMLRRAPVRSADKPKPGNPGAAYLRDDFEFGTKGVVHKGKMKDFDRAADGESDGDGESDEGDGLGGADDDDDGDGATAGADDDSDDEDLL
ncbi:hypothetical protein T492DRAFT_1016802, partial [Pavlovales sp. CCMP2436]